MKRNSKSKRITPKVKKVKLPPAHILHVEVPPKMIPAILPGPDPHVMRVVPVPADRPRSWMDFFFGPEKK